MQEHLFCSHTPQYLSTLLWGGIRFLLWSYASFLFKNKDRAEHSHHREQTSTQAVLFLPLHQPLLPSYHPFHPSVEVNEWWIAISRAGSNIRPEQCKKQTPSNFQKLNLLKNTLRSSLRQLNRVQTGPQPDSPQMGVWREWENWGGGITWKYCTYFKCPRGEQDS